MRKYLLVIGALVFVWVLNGRGGDIVESPTATVDAAVDDDGVSKRIGIQVGHWQNEDLPDELWKLRDYSLGGEVSGQTEWELCLSIAELTKQDLESDGYAVDLIPATVPESYQADAFISLHTDGNDDTSVSGYKTAASAWDETDESESLAQAMMSGLAKTDLGEASYISEEMNEYYAFNYTKYDHAVSPSTPAAIVELGFLTNYSDRSYLTNRAEEVAASLADGVRDYLQSHSN